MPDAWKAPHAKPYGNNSSITESNCNSGSDPLTKCPMI